MTYMTRETALADLKLLNPRDAIKVLRDYVSTQLCESYGMCDVLDGLDRIEDDYFPSDPDPRFVSSDYSYEVRAGIHAECR